MSSPIYIPSSGFNNNPVSTTVRTASYTIPAGRYARVIVECDSGGTITINGSSAVTTAGFINIDASSSANANLNYTVPSDYMATFASMGGSGSGDFAYFNGNTSSVYAASTTSRSGDVAGAKIGPGGTASVLFGSFGTREIAGVAEPSNATHRQAEFWLPTGTVLSGTGNWRAVVMEYNT